MKTKSTRTDYVFEIGNLDVKITHETETDQDFASVEIPELCLIANQLDELILALLEVRRDMKLRGYQSGKPGRTVPEIDVIERVVMS